MMMTMRTEEGAEETLQGEKKGANALFSFRKTTLNASFSDTDKNAIPKTTTATAFSLQTFSLLR
jgi:hypothetical protein